MAPQSSSLPHAHFLALVVAALTAIGSIVALIVVWADLDIFIASTASRTDRTVAAGTPVAIPRQMPGEPASIDLKLDSFLPSQKLNLSPDQALKANLASPLARTNPPAPLFDPAWVSESDLVAATNCMTKAIYYEASGEPPVGQMAVAQVILNRLRHPRFPKTICGVVFQGANRPNGCQFTFTCDGSMRRTPDRAGLARAHIVADAALHGAISFVAGQATHYHTIWIVPLWANQMIKVAIIGHHVFYRPPNVYGGWPEQVPGGKTVRDHLSGAAVSTDDSAETTAQSQSDPVQALQEDGNRTPEPPVTTTAAKALSKSEDPPSQGNFDARTATIKAPVPVPKQQLFGRERRGRSKIPLPPSTP